MGFSTASLCVNKMKLSLIHFLSSIGIIHVAIAIFTTKELFEYPLIKKQTKPYWFVLIWLIPIVGAILFRNYYKLGWEIEEGVGNSQEGPGVDDD